MKIKVYVIDVKMPRWVRRAVVLLVAPLVVLGIGALVHASLPAAVPTFVEGAVLTAAQLNQLGQDITDLDNRLVATQQQIPAAPPFAVLESASDANQTAAFGADLVYTSASLTLTPGTWLVEGFATVRTTDVGDAVEVGLYDTTNAADIPNSRGGVGYADPGAQVALHTTKVLTVSKNTIVQIKAYRNGASTLAMGYQSALAGGTNRIIALQLK